MTQQDDRHVCPACGKSYERADHLQRHCQSHQNHRQFRCRLCPKGFNRADLLRRHESAHARDDDRTNGSRQIERVSQACTACIRAKAKCSDSKPCTRCQAKSIECIQRNLNLSLAYSNPRQQSRQSKPVEACQESKTFHQQEVMRPNESRDPIRNDPYLDPWSSTTGGTCTVSSTLEGVDLPWCDIDSLNLALGTFGDTTTHNLGVADDAKANDSSNPTSTRSWPLPSYLSTRSQAYQRSPWTGWQPSRFQHSFHDQSFINLGAGSIKESTKLFMKGSTGRTLDRKLDDACRDHLLVLVTAMKISHFSIHSFPPAELLNDLVQSFFIQESASLVSSIHRGTFSCCHMRPELLLGVIAAGAVIIPERRIQVTGLVIHEILRTAMANLFESDNSTTRDLQALQAYMTALEVGAWSGLKRKTEIACSFMQPGYTMLFQAGAFSLPMEREPAQKLYERADELHRGWKSWALKESLKRLAIRAFIHDSQVSMAYFQAPTISYAELNMPVPSRASLWFADCASEWREWFLACNNGERPFLLAEILADVTVLDRCSGQVDLQLCCFVAIHALANQVWDLQQQFTILFSTPETKRRRINSWYMSRQRDLYEDLITIRMYCERHVAHHEISLLLEYVMMALHAPLANIQRFAGKEGESEAQRVTLMLSEWRQSSTTQIAIWHAGQVFRTARQFPPNTLQNFYAVATYHAALVLWVYSMLDNQALSHAECMIPDGTSRNMPANNSSITLVRLDGEENEDARAFRTLGHGTPCLSHPTYSEVIGPFCTLADPALTMRLSTDILRSNLLSTDHIPPLLVRNLIGLMEDLSSSLGCFRTGGNSSTDTTR